MEQAHRGLHGALLARGSFPAPPWARAANSGHGDREIFGFSGNCRTCIRRNGGTDFLLGMGESTRLAACASALGEESAHGPLDTTSFSDLTFGPFFADPSAVKHLLQECSRSEFAMLGTWVALLFGLAFAFSRRPRNTLTAPVLASAPSLTTAPVVGAAPVLAAPTPPIFASAPIFAGPGGPIFAAAATPWILAAPRLTTHGHSPILAVGPLLAALAAGLAHPSPRAAFARGPSVVTALGGAWNGAMGKGASVALVTSSFHPESALDVLAAVLALAAWSTTISSAGLY
mmetsp:Transcript_52536/g.153061  ORF Transcript_52536/g.153061 Transcript_52536/m.153061 type:complete len:288 (-) Transcript_52536:174-1037(-)